MRQRPQRHEQRLVEHIAVEHHRAATLLASGVVKRCADRPARSNSAAGVGVKTERNVVYFPRGSVGVSDSQPPGPSCAERFHVELVEHVGDAEVTLARVGARS